MAGWFWRRLGRGAPGEEAEREVEFHLEMRAREFEASGMSPEEARAAAASSFGDVAGITDALRRSRGRRSVARVRRELLASLGGDVRLALRVLSRSPGFTVTVGATLGVGIALASVWVAMANAYLANGLPFPDADRLVMVQGQGSPDWQDVPDVFERTVSWDLDALSIVGDGTPQTVLTSWVSPDWFVVTGARPALGRFFSGEEAGPGGRALAVISHALWQGRWAGDPDIIGRTFAAYSSDRPEEAEVFTIIGVLPAGFWYLNQFTDVIAPLRTPRDTYMATLRPGVPLADAQAVLVREAQARDPQRADVLLVDAHDAYVERIRPMVLALGGAVVLVLLIVLGNASSLVLVRAMAREQEFAVRAAIGAGRVRMGRQLAAEGALLAGIASAFGIVLGWLVLVMVGSLLPRVLGGPAPGGGPLSFDGAALVASIAVCAAVGVALAMVPVVHVWRRDVLSSLRANARGTSDPRRQRLRSTLVAGELALSLALAIGAGLLVRSVMHMTRVPLGFDPAGTVALGVSLRQTEFDDAGERAELYRRMIASIDEGVNGVEVSIAGWAPFGRSWSLPVETPGQRATGNDDATAFMTVATPDYFEQMGIRRLRGRSFEATDGAGAEPVAIVSESLARQLWPGRDAIGRRVRMAPDPNATLHAPAPVGSGSPASSGEPSWRLVVGVVADVSKTLTEENPPDVYYPLAQAAPAFVEIVVRDRGGRVRLDDVRAAIWRVHADVPLDDIRWLEDDIALATLPSRFLAMLLSGFGAFAVLMASVGVWGVVAYTVSQRRREIAIRMALGATQRAVTATFVRYAAGFTLAGLVSGIAGGLALSRVLRSQLHGVSPGDPVTYGAVALLLAAVAFIAMWLPARRAARTEPRSVLQ